MKRQRGVGSNQRGIVTIIVALILTIVLSLLTIGFTRIIGREQRQTVDTQLSTQAFYAAESGINDTVKAITTKNYTANKTTCADDAALGLTPILDPSNPNVKYTCILINQQPGTLEYGSLDVDKTKVIPVTPVDSNNNPADIETLTIHWGPTTNSGTPFSSGTVGTFPTQLNWQAQTGMLRVELVPLIKDGSGNISRNSMLQNSFTVFLYPDNNGSVGQSGSLAYSTAAAQQGQVVGGKCNAGNGTFGCTVKITSIGLSHVNLSSPNYMLLIRPVYRSAAVQVEATDSNTKQLQMSGTQILIDATGRAQDVLKRIQVRVPRSTGDLFPEYAIESADTLCKRLLVTPGVGAAPDTTGATEPACQIN